MYKVFDIHTHVYPEKIAARAVENLGKFYDFVPEGDGTYTTLESASRENGVVGFLIFSVATNAHQVENVNSYIAESVKNSRKRGFDTVGFAGMHQDFPDFAAEIDRAEANRLRGVKIHPDIQRIDIDDPRMMELYEIVEGRMPVYFHMGDNRPEYQFSQPEKLLKVLKMFPRLEVVAAHLGGYKSWESGKALANCPNVWFDTSSALWAMTPEKAREMISVLGSERVMFGTDYPVKMPREEIDRVLAIDLSEKEREDIFYNNAQRFLNLRGV